MGALMLWLGGAIAAALHTAIEHRLGPSQRTAVMMTESPVFFWTSTVLAVVLWPFALAFMLAMADAERNEKKP